MDLVAFYDKIEADLSSIIWNVLSKRRCNGGKSGKRNCTPEGAVAQEEKKLKKKLWGLKIIAATTPYIGHNEWCFKVSKNLKNYYKKFLLHFSFIFSLSWKMRDRIIFLSIVTSSSFHSNVNIWAQLKRCVVKVYEWRLKLWWYKNIIIYVFFAHVIEISCLNNKNVKKKCKCQNIQLNVRFPKSTKHTR